MNDDLKGRHRKLTGTLSRNVSGGAGEKGENLSQDNPGVSAEISNREFTKCNSKALPNFRRALPGLWSRVI
jgi:hypothetical protein